MRVTVQALRWASTAVLAAGLMLCALATGAPTTATANKNYFCWADGTFKYVDRTPPYCVGNGYRTLNQVKWSLQNGGGVNHCALAKFNSDGSGSNALPTACGEQQHVYTLCLYFDATSYPKGTNESSSPHYF